MSAIIAVCGKTFCAFVADLRLVSIDENGDIRFNNDNTEKIFKLNNQLVYGATGIFNSNETFFTPLDFFEDYTYLTVNPICAAINEYMFSNLSMLKRNKARTYLIGGKDNNGEFTLHAIKYDATTNTIINEDYTPSEDGITFCLSLPSQAILYEENYKSMVKKAIINSSTDLDLVKNTSSVIKEIAKMDSTVSEKSMAIVIR